MCPCCLPGCSQAPEELSGGESRDMVPPPPTSGLCLYRPTAATLAAMVLEHHHGCCMCARWVKTLACVCRTWLLGDGLVAVQPGCSAGHARCLARGASPSRAGSGAGAGAPCRHREHHSPHRCYPQRHPGYVERTAAPLAVIGSAHADPWALLAPLWQG
jgi:hypothetical protein